jgi:hypothetical protein
MLPKAKSAFFRYKQENKLARNVKTNGFHFVKVDNHSNTSDTAGKTL